MCTTKLQDSDVMTAEIKRVVAQFGKSVVVVVVNNLPNTSDKAVSKSHVIRQPDADRFLSEQSLAI